MVTADDILAGRNTTEVSSAQVVMVEGVVICNELVPTADVMMYSNQNGSVKGEGYVYVQTKHFSNGVRKHEHTRKGMR